MGGLHRGLPAVGAAGVDAGRLGEACGGKLGMAPAGAWQGELREGDEWTGELTLRPGDCVRLLAVGGSGVTALSLALLDERGRVVAGDGSDDGWPLVPPDGTTCVVAGGPYAVRARSVRGAGPFAAQAWRLP